MTGEKQWNSQSLTYDFSSKNKIKLMEIDILNNVLIQKRFTEFDI